MALIHKESGEYLRVNKEYLERTFKNIRHLIYKSQELRTSPDGWVVIKEDSLHCNKIIEKLDVKADNEQSILDNLISAMYEAMKEENVIKLNYEDAL